MGPVPFHTPYDGSSKPFTIALKPLDVRDWMEVDDRLAEYLAEKDALFARQHADVFMAAEDTIASQQEVLTLLSDYLPGRYSADNDEVSVKLNNKTYRFYDFATRPLELAARLVQEDLVLMRKVEGEHRLVAAALCFPSAWLLAEKFGRPMADIHEPVPGFGARGSYRRHDRADLFEPETRSTGRAPELVAL